MKLTEFTRVGVLLLHGTVVLMCALVPQANASSLEQAKRLHDRLVGTPPSPELLLQMASDIDGGNAIDAARTAMQQADFYNVTVKNLAAPWTSEAQSPFVDFNDYTATVIGYVRDDRDFRGILYDDILYVGNSSTGAPSYAINDNAHYQHLEDNDIDLATQLEARDQSSLNGLPSQASAGVITSRAAAKAFFIDGTNRAMFRFTLMNHLCLDLEQVKDTSLPPDRIRQDVSRSPGGDSRIFLNSCVGCHNGMDPLAQAYAYYEFEHDVDNDPEGDDGFLVYNDSGAIDPDTGSQVQRKYHINANNFKYGYATPDDQWDNYWRSGQNAILGWSAGLPGSGSGAKSMGQELAHSNQFASCQVTKVFENVCLRPPTDSADRAAVAQITGAFRNSGYQLKQVFAEAAVYCMGE